MKGRLYDQMLALTLDGLANSLDDFMPPCAYRDFFRWALSTENPVHGVWLQIMGISQLVEMTLELLGGTVDDSTWEDLVRWSVGMNVYQIYEIVSDNLAIGLGIWSADDVSFNLRRSVLRRFNQAMISRLNGHGLSAAELLADSRALTANISAFRQSLKPQKLKSIAGAYVVQYGHVPLEELEYATWPLLVANIESCLSLARSVGNHAAGTLIREGLIDRYQAVDALLVETGDELPSRLRVSADAILVAPTLAYYVSVLAEKVRPVDGFRQVVDNGSLEEILYHAALLVRLLNDLGRLVTQAHDQHTALMAELRSNARLHTSASPREFLLEEAIRLGPVLTRVQKDLEHGEFNLCTSALPERDLTEGVGLFAARLAYLRQQYAESLHRLEALLECVSEGLRDDVATSLIRRFVRFHEKLYASPYGVVDGEYAV